MHTTAGLHNRAASCRCEGRAAGCRCEGRAAGCRCERRAAGCRVKAGRLAAGAKAGRLAASVKAGRLAAGAKAGRLAASAKKNRLFWPFEDKTGDSSRKPDRKADITRDSSAFGRKTGLKTASQPPQPADNRTFWRQGCRPQKKRLVIPSSTGGGREPPRAAGLLDQQRLRRFGDVALCARIPRSGRLGAPSSPSGRFGDAAPCVRLSDI